MGNLVDNKFTWVIPNFNFLRTETIFSDKFVVGGCKWELIVHPKGEGEGEYNDDYLSLFLSVAEYESLPCGWSRSTKFSLTVVNQLYEIFSRKKETQQWFDEKTHSGGFSKMLLLTKLHDGPSGFLVNGKLKIVAEVDVLEVIGKLDETEESEGTPQALKKRKQENDGVLFSDLLNKTQQLKEVNGFLVLPSHAESVKRIFEKHPNMALDFQAKNQNLRTTCMIVLLNLIDTLCQSLQDLSIDDLGQADNALTYLKISGFKVDWLERKLEEAKEKKIEEEIGETRMQELEKELKDIQALLEKKKDELKDLKQKCSDTEALLKKEKAKARTPRLTLDDVV